MGTKNSFIEKIKKHIVIFGIVTFVIAGLIGSVASYAIVALPTQTAANKDKAKYEELKKKAEVDSKEASKKLNDADDYYRKINNLKNETGNQKVTKLYQEAVVGKDIAPGNWSVKGDGYYEITDENGKSLNDLWVTDGGEHIQLKVGYTLKADPGAYTTWTPDK